MSSRRSSIYDDEITDVNIDVRYDRGRPIYSGYNQRLAHRPLYDTGVNFLAPEVNIHRSTSRRRSTPHHSPARDPRPIVINNNTYGGFDEYAHMDPRAERANERRADRLRSRERNRSHSRHRHRSDSGSPVRVVIDPMAGRDRQLSTFLSDARESNGLGFLNYDNPYRNQNARTRIEQEIQQKAKQVAWEDRVDTHLRKLQEEEEAQRRKDKEDAEKYRARYERASGSSRESALRDWDRRKREILEDEEDRDYRIWQRQREFEDGLRREEQLRRDAEPKEKRLTREEYDNIARKEALAKLDREAHEKKLVEDAREEAKAKFLKEEQEKKDEEEKLKKEHEAAVEKYKKETAEKAAKEKLEKEEQEKGYKKRAEDDMRRAGWSNAEIERVLNEKKQGQSSSSYAVDRPTYTRMARKHLSIETLQRYKVDFEFDQDPEYILIKRLVPEYEQDVFWNDTRLLREERSRRRAPLMIEETHTDHLIYVEKDKKKKPHRESEMLLVRPKHKDRRHSHSPSPLLQFMAGGKR